MATAARVKYPAALQRYKLDTPLLAAGSLIAKYTNDLCAEVYKEWGCDATVMNWAETYTALQQGTVDGEENPETAIASASVQDVQD